MWRPEKMFLQEQSVQKEQVGYIIPTVGGSLNPGKLRGRPLSRPETYALERRYILPVGLHSHNFAYMGGSKNPDFDAYVLCLGR
jgi:hypothetical protein